MLSRNSILGKIVYLYVDGFRNMTIGKTLWGIILLKLFIMFAILKAFFFPDILKERADGNEAEYVAKEFFKTSTTITEDKH